MTEPYRGWKPGGWTEQVLEKMLEWRHSPIDRITFKISMHRQIVEPHAHALRPPRGDAEPETYLQALTNRVFNALDRQGIIERERRRVTILDRGRLLAILQARMLFMPNEESPDEREVL